MERLKPKRHDNDDPTCLFKTTWTIGTVSGQADNSGGPFTALNTSAGAHPDYCVLQGISVGGGCCKPFSLICAQILGKYQLRQWCREGLECVQFSDIMVASVFADDVVLLVSSDCGL